MKSFKTFLVEGLTSAEISAIREREGIKFTTDKGHPTQRKNTANTYRKFFMIIPEELRAGVGLDYSAGLGYGSQLLRNEFSADIESYEPFPHEYAVDLTYSGLNSLPNIEYDYIINSAVLNVVEQDIRDSIVKDIFKHLKAEGCAVIGVRSRTDVLGAKTAYVADYESGEIIDRSRGSYQKGFTSSELKEYISGLLPDATVTIVGGLPQVTVKIFKDYDYSNVTDTVDYEIPKKKHPMVRELGL